MVSSRKKVVELRRALEEASWEFGLLADALGAVHSQLKAPTRNAAQIKQLRVAQDDAIYLAGRFYALCGDGSPDPEASGELGRWGSRIGKGATVLLLALGSAADMSQVLGTDLSKVVEQSGSATEAADKVTTCSLHLYLPGNREEPNPDEPISNSRSEESPDAAPDEEVPHSASNEPDGTSSKFKTDEIEPGADLSGRDLAGVNLYRAKLYGADLRLANLAGANLTGANLVEADLVEANLTEANLDEADLYGAKLFGADLTGAMLSRTNLLGTTNLGRNVLTGVRWDPDAPPSWPKGFDPPQNAWEVPVTDG